MRWIRVLAIIASLAAVVHATYATGGTKEAAGNAPDSGKYPVRRTVQYGFTLQNTAPRLLKKAEFWTYAPVKQTSSQKVIKLSASYPYRLITDELGNQVMQFEFENLPPYGSKVISVRAELAMADDANAMPLENKRRFLAPEQLVESDAERLVKVAKRVAGATPLETARNAYAWVVANVRAGTYMADDRGALYALDKKKGDCTEFMYLVAALDRANGIPARGVGGYVYDGNPVLTASDYHNWAEFYVDGAWRIADAQKRVFAQKQSLYIAMRIISSAVTNPMGHAYRFNFRGDGLKVTMN